MKKTLCSLMVLSSISLLPSVSQAEGAFGAENFSASVELTSNYLFRGISLSDDHPAISGSFDWGYNGFYLGTWASSIEPVETEALEIDYYGGYAGEYNGFAYSVDVIYYDYPGEADSGDPEDIGDLAYWEYGASLAYSFDASLAPVLGVSVLHSPDFFAETGDATAIEGTLDLSLPYEVAMSLHYGTQKLDDKFYAMDSYDYYGVAFSKTLGGFDVTVGYSDTDGDGEDFQGSSTDEVYLSIGASL